MPFFFSINVNTLNCCKEPGKSSGNNLHQATCSIPYSVKEVALSKATFFSLNFASTKFRDFRGFEKIAKFNTV